MLAELDIAGLAPAAWLAILGALLEISGFSLVAVELVRAQRRELGTVGPFQFLVTFGRWVARLYRKLRKKETAQHIKVGTAESLETAERLSIRKRPSSRDIEMRLKALEDNFEYLDKDVAHHRKELDDRIGKEARAQHAALAAFEASVQDQQEKDRKAFVASASLQWWGIGLFVLGACASAAANVVSA